MMNKIQNTNISVKSGSRIALCHHPEAIKKISGAVPPFPTATPPPFQGISLHGQCFQPCFVCFSHEPELTQYFKVGLQLGVAVGILLCHHV